MYLRLHILISTIHDSHDLHSNPYFYCYLYHFMEECACINEIREEIAPVLVAERDDSKTGPLSTALEQSVLLVHMT